VILFATAVSLEGSSDEPVEPRGEFSVAGVAKLRSDVGGSHIVEHQDSRDPPLGHGAVSARVEVGLRRRLEQGAELRGHEVRERPGRPQVVGDPSRIASDTASGEVLADPFDVTSE
jgi:hypothetical protein